MLWEKSGNTSLCPRAGNSSTCTGTFIWGAPGGLPSGSSPPCQQPRLQLRVSVLDFISVPIQAEGPEDILGVGQTLPSRSKRSLLIPPMIVTENQRAPFPRKIGRVNGVTSLHPVAVVFADSAVGAVGTVSCEPLIARGEGGLGCQRGSQGKRKNLVLYVTPPASCGIVLIPRSLHRPPMGPTNSSQQLSQQLEHAMVRSSSLPRAGAPLYPKSINKIPTLSTSADIRVCLPELVTALEDPAI
ncbi:hypothetical protein EYF80_004666 [Liparis tanakae]|uniref:Uncharacterized protein n=1 Tax=Liparis tanakae TaxID=230148 RepID=A0A4Z2J692_9TELE|nr:hypothetical protein EYF80_004666 [Liparis tanakae]